MLYIIVIILRLQYKIGTDL